MTPSRDEFDALLAEILEGAAEPETCLRFNEALHGHPEWMEVYFDQMRIHLMAERLLGTRLSEARNPARFDRARRLAAVAAAASLAVGVGLFGILRAPAPEPSLPRASASPVSVLCQDGSVGLQLPPALPGTVRLRGGIARVGLPAGTELILAGPLELEIGPGDGREARLVRGKVVVWVPQRAKGMVVRTAELEAWDIGTVFSVTADGAAGSRVFVFKGAVQVNDCEGGGAGLCEEGEGVLARPGGQPVKIAADWPEAEQLFVRVARFAALKNPADALDAAERIGDQWLTRYAPEEAWRIRERLQRSVARQAEAVRPAFSKKAWVRPSVPDGRMPQSEAFPIVRKESSAMKNKGTSAALVAAAVLGAGVSGAASEPVWVYTTRNANRHWETVSSNRVELAWRWPAGAEAAELSIAGMGGTVWETNVTTAVSNVLWQVCAPGAQPAEDVYDLALTFFDAHGAMAGAQTSRLATAGGAWGPSRVDTVTGADRWLKIRGNAVIPYDAGWTAATDGAAAGRLVIAREGLSRTFALPYPAGHFGWRVKGGGWGYGIFGLTLDFPGTVTNSWDAALTRLPEGLMFSVK